MAYSIEQALKNLSDEWPDYHVCNAARYSLLSGGKRIRPILAIEAFKVVGGMGDSIMPFACAVEMLHTSSLLVDDLMDNHEERRGKPTCWVQYGIGVAVLASHYISSCALGLIENPRCLSELIDTVSLMCIGQDREIAELKTGSLIRASVRGGAIMGGASQEQLDALSKYGDHVGLLFQLVDDFIDGDRPREQLSLDLSCLEIFGSKADSLREIARFIMERTK